ncbi:MAG: GNAT family N-acetyltransferase [Lachnospiraceae bacterium]|nr:GNAT family N-acetyltransferase [Lachnospiraceae bacterium]
MISVHAIKQEQAEEASAFLLPESAKALKKGLPVAAFAVVEDETAIGALAGAAMNGVFEVHSIYVHPDHRRRGAGRALIDSLEKYTTEMDLGIKVEYTLQSDDNKTLAPFLEAMDFIEDPVHFPNYCLSPLSHLNINVNGSAELYKDVVAFFDVPEKILLAMEDRALREGFPMPEGGLVSDRIDREMSFCSVKNDWIRAYVAVENLGDDLIRIPAVWSELNDPREMMVMLSKSIVMMKKSFPPEYRVAMLALNPRSFKLMEHVCGKVEQCSFRYIRKD